MKNGLINIKRLEIKEDLEKLCREDLVILSLGSGKIYDEEEYYGIAIYSGKSLFGKGYEKWAGYDFCRPQANNNCLVRYHIPEKNYTMKENGKILIEDNIIITKNGEISAKEFFICGGNDQEIVKKSGLI